MGDSVASVETSSTDIEAPPGKFSKPKGGLCAKVRCSCCWAFPFWPFVSIVIAGAAGALALTALVKVSTSIGIRFSPAAVLGAQILFIIIMVLDVVFATAIFSQKLRVRNVRCSSEGALNCCGPKTCIGRCFSGCATITAWRSPRTMSN